MNLARYIRLFAAAAVAFSAPVWCDTAPAKVGQYAQEVATKYTMAQGLPSDNVSAIGIDPSGVVYITTTDAGMAKFENGAWAVVAEDQRATVAAIVKAPDTISIGAGRTLHFVEPDPAAAPELHQVVAASVGGLFSGSAPGNYYLLQPMTVKDGEGRIWSSADVRGITFDSAGQLWFCTLAGAACRIGENWKFYEGTDGLPFNDFTCAQSGPDGVVWFGTKKGAIRFEPNTVPVPASAAEAAAPAAPAGGAAKEEKKGLPEGAGEGDFQYRQGLLWLPNDEVRDIAVDASGNAWFATAGGVGLIERRPMTLWQKAQHYEQEMEKIKRTEYGYVSEVSLKTPGDTSPENIIYTDSDNDGLWTSMYGAGECFGYAATKDPALKEHAKKAFEALRFLQTVTQGGEHPAPKGYVARTILPVEGTEDPNLGRLERDQKEQAEGDKIWKAYEPRWPKSADGKWYWKSDTSSDELDGHYFFYPRYYDLACETEEEKEAVRQVVRDLTDHLIDHGYRLVDHTGTVTRWGEYSPEGLNHDPNWWIERGLKSLSMLSYLAVAHHMTGDQKYLDHFMTLANEHNYLFNAMVTKIHLGVGSSNQSDDEMAIMSYYNLLAYMPQDESMRNLMRYSFYSRYALEQPEMNPFFNFAYAAFGLGQSYTSTFGSYPIEPWHGWLDDSLRTLKGFPLDRMNWGHENSHRLDILPLRRQQYGDPADAPPRKIRRGSRINTGKVIPIEDRFFNHWNTDPWDLDYGGQGQGLASGAVYLLPYYMGLYHGFIEKDS
ncbi:MAG: hypothetical protein HYV26_10835 [Candidatus Hydrogenedentes bacterium]|nr:hypothetical protein [Candidatus Hydrogenedentota bacterium]